MNTPFDVGDKITFTVTGKIHRFEQREGEDGCYTIYVKDEYHEGSEFAACLYVDSQDLIKMAAKKIND